MILKISLNYIKLILLALIILMGVFSSESKALSYSEPFSNYNIEFIDYDNKKIKEIFKIEETLRNVAFFERRFNHSIKETIKKNYEKNQKIKTLKSNSQEINHQSLQEDLKQHQQNLNLLSNFDKCPEMDSIVKLYDNEKSINSYYLKEIHLLSFRLSKEEIIEKAYCNIRFKYFIYKERFEKNKENLEAILKFIDKKHAEKKLKIKNRTVNLTENNSIETRAFVSGLIHGYFDKIKISIQDKNATFYTRDISINESYRVKELGIDPKSGGMRIQTENNINLFFQNENQTLNIHISIPEGKVRKIFIEEDKNSVFYNSFKSTTTLCQNLQNYISNNGIVKNDLQIKILENMKKCSSNN